MSALSVVERKRFEKLFGMSSGKVLDLTNATFAEIFRQDVGVDIYDEKYSFNGDSKAKRLRAFWEVESEKQVGKALFHLLQLLDYQNGGGVNTSTAQEFKEAFHITTRLLSDEGPEESEADFLRHNFGQLSFDGLGFDSKFMAILDSRAIEASACIKSGAPLAAVFMCGSMLEGVLLFVASKNPAEFNRAAASPKQVGTDKAKLFEDWSLCDLINVAHEIGLIRLDVKKFSHALRDFRNYIHPNEQVKSDFHPDQLTAQICFQVLRAAIAGLKESRLGNP